MTKHRTLACLAFTVVILFFSFVSFAQEISTDPAVISAGKGLFDANCKSCHRVKEKLIGPALAGVDQRVPSLDWLVDWVHNPAKMIASGDEYANKIFIEYNKSQMTAFTGMSSEQIMSIVAYVKDEETKVAAPPPGTDGLSQTPTDAGIPKAYLNAILIGMGLILILLLVVLGLIANALKRFLETRDLNDVEKQVVQNPYTLKTITSSPGFIFVVVFIVAGVSFKTIVDGLYSIGVQQGYQPKQPIAFSHKIHAGQYEIDCKYCHTGAMTGKQATIPSVNVCMNCHSQVKSGTLTGTGEIQKIYDAVGFDPNTSAYTGKTTGPVEWIRIHNLPDLAYFNHSQHVNVGGIECQTCHGPVEEMEVVRQYSLLTMGWCIDCHRKTDVATKGNAYYDKLVEYHKEGKKNNMKVEDIGGLECGKCHY
jgi:mono/diheme cytochrome c family protein